MSTTSTWTTSCLHQPQTLSSTQVIVSVDGFHRDNYDLATNTTIIVHNDWQPKHLAVIQGSTFTRTVWSGDSLRIRNDGNEIITSQCKKWIDMFGEEKMNDLDRP